MGKAIPILKEKNAGKLKWPSIHHALMGNNKAHIRERIYLILQPLCGRANGVIKMNVVGRVWGYFNVTHLVSRYFILK